MFKGQAYPVPLAHQEAVDEEINRILKLNVIVP